MNIIIFAGGAGTRLWPISRKNSPKQFEILKGKESTLQLACNRIKNYGRDNLFISTNKNYKNLVQSQISDIAEDHIFTEPSRRDLGAAVLLTLLKLKQKDVSGSIAMLWSDHFMDDEATFLDALEKGESLLKDNPNRFVFLAEKPRFANHNLGWINLGEKTQEDAHAFEGWKYRPEVTDCEEMFKSGKWYWNPGYFLFDIDFVLSLYKKHQPALFDELSDMVKTGVDFDERYNKLPKLSFDEAVVEHISKDQAVVLKVDMGWSDPGTLYALKEALAEKQEHNATKGNTFLFETKDSFVYNEDEHKVVTTIGLDGMLVINTQDGLLVCHKHDVHKIKNLLSEMDVKGLEKYL